MRHGRVGSGLSSERSRECSGNARFWKNGLRGFDSRGNTRNTEESREFRYGWEAGIRTPITASRAPCPTVERPPKVGVPLTTRVWRAAEPGMDRNSGLYPSHRAEHKVATRPR